MKVVHFFLGKANPNRANGVNQVLNGYGKYLPRYGVDLIMIGLSNLSKGKTLDVIEREGFKVNVFSKFSSIIRWFSENYLNIDLVHLHGVWNSYNIILARYLKKWGIPYVVTLHGGLLEDRLKQSKYYLKLIYHGLFQRRYLDNAAALHAITKEEMYCISKHTNNEYIFFVPNGIDLEKLGNFFSPKKYEHASKRIKFGYLGRFGPEKNILSLLRAINSLSPSIRNSIECFLIGPLNEDYKKLKKLVYKMNLETNVKFIGPKYGIEKYKILKSLDFYVHPAYSDVVSLAVMEAFACGLPAVISRTSHVSYYYCSGAFVMVEPIPQDIKRGIVEMIKRRNEWEKMSYMAYNLIKDSLNWGNISKEMCDVYERIAQV